MATTFRYLQARLSADNPASVFHATFSPVREVQETQAPHGYVSPCSSPSLPKWPSPADFYSPQPFASPPTPACTPSPNPRGSGVACTAGWEETCMNESCFCPPLLGTPLATSTFIDMVLDLEDSAVSSFTRLSLAPTSVLSEFSNSGLISPPSSIFKRLDSHSSGSTTSSGYGHLPLSSNLSSLLGATTSESSLGVEEHPEACETLSPSSCRDTSVPSTPPVIVAGMSRTYSSSGSVVLSQDEKASSGDNSCEPRPSPGFESPCIASRLSQSSLEDQRGADESKTPSFAWPRQSPGPRWLLKKLGSSFTALSRCFKS